MNKEKGFLKIIILIIVALALLKFVFDFDVIEFIKTPKVQDTLHYIWYDIIVFLWENYIRTPLSWAWDQVKHLTKLGWDSLIILLDKIKEIAVELTS